MKVTLEHREWTAWHAPGNAVKVITASLPFYKSIHGKYTHRIRSGLTHWRHNKMTHASFTMWCGQIGSSHKGILTDTMLEGEVMCATCEGRAIGAGKDSKGDIDNKRIINGRPVIFTPKAK